MLKSPTKEDMAYIAGFVDGDGSIVAHISRGRTVQIRVVSYQNNIEPLKFISLFYKGYFQKSPKGYHQFSIDTQDETRRIIEDISPYLIVKSKQATIALIILGYKLKFRDEKEGRRGENSPYREREFELAKELSDLQAYPRRNGRYKKIFSSRVEQSV